MLGALLDWGLALCACLSAGAFLHSHNWISALPPGLQALQIASFELRANGLFSSNSFFSWAAWQLFVIQAVVFTSFLSSALRWLRLQAGLCASCAGRKRSSFSGKSNVLITGAASGIGRATALLAARAGVPVIFLWDVNGAGLRAVKAEMEQLQDAVATVTSLQGPGRDASSRSSNGAGRSRIVLHTVDLCDPQDIAAGCEAALAEAPGGCIHAVVSNAGIVVGKDIDRLSAAEVTRTFGVNCLANFHLLRYLLPAMKREVQQGQGSAGAAAAASAHCSYVMTSSIMGTVGSAMLSDYCSSKWAVQGLAECVRLELQRDGLGERITVSTVCPYVVGTGMFTGIFQDKKSSNPLRDILFKPLSAEDVAEAIVEAVGSPVSVNRTMPVIIAWVHCFVRLLPLGLQDAIIGFFGGWHGMTSFQGRGKEREQAGGQSSPSAAEGAATTAHATAAASADQRKDSSSPLPSDARKRSNSVSASSRSVQKPSSSSSLSSGSVAAAAVSPRHRGTGRTVGSGAAAMPQR